MEIKRRTILVNATLQELRPDSWSQRLGIEFADPTVGADDEGERESVPVLVRIGGFVERGVGAEGTPVAAVVGGDVGAAESYGDPGFGGGVVGYGGAVAVGWGRRAVLSLEEQVFQYWTERQHRKVAQCRHDDQEPGEQNAKGEGIRWQRSESPGSCPLLCEQTGKGERWNGQAKSPSHHGNRRHDVIEGRVGAKAGEGLAIVGKAGSKCKQDLRESMRQIGRAHV